MARQPQTARTTGPETYDLRGVGRIFGSRQAAIDFLRGSAPYVGRNWDYLKKNYPALLLDAGLTKDKQGIRITKAVPFKVASAGTGVQNAPARYAAAARLGFQGGGDPSTGAKKTFAQVAAAKKPVAKPVAAGGPVGPVGV